MLDRTQAPPFQPIERIDVVRAQTQLLTNGVPLHVIDAGVQPVTVVELIFRAGDWFEPRRGVSRLTSKMLTEGTAQRTGPALQEAISRYGAFLQVGQGQDLMNVSLFALTRYLPELLPYLVEIVNESVFPEKALTNQRRQVQQNLLVSREKTSYRASVRLRSLLFGEDHPYGAPLLAAVLDLVDREALRDFSGAYLGADNVEVVMAGRCSDREVGLVANAIGQLRNCDRPPVSHPLAETDEPRRERLPMPGRTQASLRLGRLAIPMDHSDFTGLVVLNELFGGFFGSRLMRNIREEKGLTYGIYSHLASLQQATMWAIGAEINQQAADQVIEEIRGEIKTLRDELVEEEELSVVRSYLLGKLAGSVTTPFELADKFKSVHFSGVGYDYYDHLVDTIQTVTPSTLRDLAQRYLDPDALHTVVAGGA